MRCTASASARKQLERLADDLASSKHPVTLEEFGTLLASDTWDSPEDLARYFGKGFAWVSTCKQVLINNRLIDEAAFWKAFPSSMSRQREPIVLPPAGPGVVDNTVTVRRPQTDSTINHQPIQ